jgi:RNA polymerase sigma-70 factor (ECF subfamily)
VVAGLTLLAGSQPAAEDAVQEALARAWERGDRGERIETLKAWVTVVATNLLRSRWRRILAERRARGRLTDLLAVTPDQPVGDRLEVFEAVRALPPRQREVVVLHYYLDLTVADVARTIHSSEGAVKNALHHARRSLAARLDAPDSREANDVHGR